MYETYGYTYIYAYIYNSDPTQSESSILTGRVIYCLQAVSTKLVDPCSQTQTYLTIYHCQEVWWALSLDLPIDFLLPGLCLVVSQDSKSISLLKKILVLKYLGVFQIQIIQEQQWNFRSLAKSTLHCLCR